MRAAGTIFNLEYSRCASCNSLGLCAADCSLGPWNHDLEPTTRVGHLKRQRKWIGSPIDHRYVFFLKPPRQVIGRWF